MKEENNTKNGLKKSGLVKMNKKQLIVTWLIVAILCGVILLAPQKHVIGGYAFDIPTEGAIPKILWELVLQRVLVVLLIGGLLIYTLRDKKGIIKNNG